MESLTFTRRRRRGPDGLNLPVPAPSLRDRFKTRPRGEEMTMAKLEIHQFMCRSDNFGVLLHDPETGRTASIDAPEEAPIRAALEEKGWKLTPHPHDPSPRRPRRGQHGTEAGFRRRDHRPEGRGRPHPGHRPRGGRRRHAGFCRPPDRGHLDARPHRRPRQLLLSRRRPAVRRRYAVRARMRPRLRGHARPRCGIR